MLRKEANNLKISGPSRKTDIKVEMSLTYARSSKKVDVFSQSSEWVGSEEQMLLKELIKTRSCRTKQT